MKDGNSKWHRKEGRQCRGHEHARFALLANSFTTFVVRSSCFRFTPRMNHEMRHARANDATMLRTTIHKIGLTWSDPPKLFGRSESITTGKAVERYRSIRVHIVKNWPTRHKPKGDRRRTGIEARHLFQWTPHLTRTSVRRITLWLLIRVLLTSTR